MRIEVGEGEGEGDEGWFKIHYVEFAENKFTNTIKHFYARRFS